ncbi:transcription factor Adf-1-like [Osmerus eperlanus]|uniref:transcription factor Adf-1-like n=1 Tax=Osmerus eperlanus TaxID=29151 RepID=UPI002E1525B3
MVNISSFLGFKMEEKLIVCVAGYPVLYDTSLYSYRDVNIKNDAWRKVAEIVGAPAEDCKKKRKNLRDSYKREKNKEKELSRSGAGLTNHKPWKYAAVMGFLAPFMEYRDSSSNFQRPATTSSVSQVSDDEIEQTATQPDSEPGQSGTPASEARASPASQAAATTSQPPASSGRKRVRKERLSAFEERMLGALEMAQTPAPLPPPQAEDEDELFFQSLLPALKRLPPAKQSEYKFNIHCMFFEAEMQAHSDV